MKKFLSVTLAALASLSAFSQSLYEQYQRVLTEPRTYTCFRTTKALKIDGKLDDADWNKAASTAPFVDISGEGFPTPKYETTAKMLWDDDYLYVGALLVEPDIRANLTQRDTIIYYDNDFEVFIDPDGNGHSYFEIETNARGVIFDLMLDRPYRNGGNFMIQWDCPGLITAIHCEGTLNNPNDTDRYWSVEMAIPHKALTINFDNPLKAGNTWRINFSRVEWLKVGGPEENWVWSPTGKIDMHMPDRWGYLYFCDQPVGSNADVVWEKPYNGAIYKLLWAMFYAQQDAYARQQNYLRDAKQFFLTDTELSGLPEGAQISVDANSRNYVMSISDPDKQMLYLLNSEGRFWTEKITPRTVKNWVWTGMNKRPEAEWKQWFALLKECGISAVLFEGYDEEVYRWCHEAGLEAHHWKWTMNRGELLDKHPDWYAVNRNGESCHDNPAYVSYYRFLCPNHQGVASYLAADYVEEAHKPYVDGVHLDYVRMPDVVLPVGLWSKYGIEQKEELPEYDYCYCDVCRELFKAKTGQDPLEIQYPMESQSWMQFRLDAITHIVDSITRAVKKDHKFISAAVFPGPSMARKMVRQDWGEWTLDAFFPMIYNKFYFEGPEWIGQSVAESVKAVDGKADIYAGLMFGDIKDNFEEALDQAFDNGASGVSFFAGPNEEYLRRFKAYLDKRGFVVK